MRRLTFPAAFLCALAGSGGRAVAQENRILVPVGTIYPGDIVRGAMLQTDYAHAAVSEGVVVSGAEIIGKAARRTLLAGRPIPLDAVEDPHTVINGGPVRLVYTSPGLTITAPGQALQAASVGESIRVRNSDSGIVVVGTVAADGTVRVAR